MSIGFKIRALLLILGICCLGTALSIKHALTNTNILTREASILQKNLSAKEQLVQAYLADDAKMNLVKEFSDNPELALNFINEFRNEGINLLVYSDETLTFWSSSLVLPKSINNIREGISFVNLSNGYYECIKKTEGSFTTLFLITIKSQYRIENQYLINKVAADLSPAGLLDIASFSDNPDQIQNINRLDGKFLFSVKLASDKNLFEFSLSEVLLWSFGLFFICIFMHSLCSWLAKRGYLIYATLILALFFLLLRLSDLEFGWFNHQFNMQIFDPRIYGESFYFPSLGDLLLNFIALTWVSLFVYANRNKYNFPPKISNSKIIGLLLHLLFLILFFLIGYLTDDVFFGLIYNSRIGFDINIINLNWVSWICVLLLCLAWFNIYLIAIVFIKWTLKLKVNNKERLLLFLVSFAFYFIYRYFTDFTAFFIVYALILFLLAYNIYVQKRRFSLLIFAGSFFCMAAITSVKYIKFTDIKEKNFRFNIAKRLQTADDPKVINAIGIFEKGIESDSILINYFTNPTKSKLQGLQDHIEKRYLDGFLSRFEIKSLVYNSADESLNYEDSTPLSNFRQLVKLGSLKTLESNYFYRINNTFGYQNYFGIIPVSTNGKNLGTLIVELKSQPYNYNLRFPDLLIDGKIKSETDYNVYSFAFYNRDVLIVQSGQFTYSMINKDFHAKTGKIIFENDYVKKINHLVYAPTDSRIIVVSKPRIAYVTRLAALSFFFLLFIIFSFIVYIIIWFIKNLEKNTFVWYNLNKYLVINANQILYKTRIQFSIILAVVVTLLVVGWTTFFNISEEYRRQQADMIRDKIRKVQVAYENQIVKKGLLLIEQSEVDFNQFADINSTFLNLYNTQGELILTSLPKLYDIGIIGRKMEPRAFLQLSKLQSSEYINTEEKIGAFKYAAAYVPIRGPDNSIIAYLGSPYYSNEADYESKIGQFVNTLINIYALVFVAIGILAVFLANQITNPLTIIQESIKKTKLGQRNQPIHWTRHDEIGTLIKEYNKMIAALELSATKLAKSEREHAWREMAKQVAHEIKNPLTPLKLGVQLLERSWKEGDPNFEKKFENFNKSFIEQIDSLATIASEFSNFAKMPDAKLEKLDLLPIINQTKDVFKNTDHVNIVVNNQAGEQILVLGDKDQLLRTFNNLLKNAIEAIPENHEGKVVVEISEDEEDIIIEVIDNGRGIDATLHGNIFVPNFTTKSSGTGLGLAFVKQAVETSGGTIRFESDANKGTSFILKFPKL